MFLVLDLREGIEKGWIREKLIKDIAKEIKRKMETTTARLPPRDEQCLSADEAPDEGLVKSYVQ